MLRLDRKNCHRKMSRQAIKAINWAALAERIPEAEKAALAAFKSKSDKYLQRLVKFIRSFHYSIIYPVI